MNIWIVSEGEPLPIDGENVRLRRMGLLAEEINNQSNSVHWFCSTFHHYKKTERTSESTTIEYKKRYFIHLIKGKKYKKNVSLSRLLHYKRLSAKFTSLADKLEVPDVILCTMAPINLAESVVKFAERNNIPVIIDVRDLWPEIFYEVVPSWSKQLIKPYVRMSMFKLKKIVEKSTSVIGVTQGFLDYALDVAGIKGRLNDKVFHTSYKEKTINNDMTELYDNKYNFNSNDFIVSFIGNFGGQFELDSIFQAAEKLKDNNNIKFVLCGNGQNYEKYLKHSQLMNNVIMTGWIEGDEIQYILSKTHLGIAPYRNSINFRLNIPNKFGEYLSSSIPILVSVEGEMKKLLEIYKCGRKYESSIDLAEKIEEYSNDRELLKVYSSNAYKLYNNNFNSEVVYKNMLSFIEGLSSQKAVK